MRQIAIAFHDYHDFHGHLPPAYSVDANDNPLHSWRVLILPFMEQNSLYSKIRLDEPWDSPYNQQFHSRMPVDFACPSYLHHYESEGCTNYAMLRGQKTMFETLGPITLQEIADLDGTSNTIMIAELDGTSIPWMKPDDISLDDFHAQFRGKKYDRKTHTHPAGINVCFGDASVHTLNRELEHEVVEGLSGIKDGIDVVGF